VLFLKGLNGGISAVGSRHFVSPVGEELAHVGGENHFVID
jgi:hypothetical protein